MPNPIPFRALPSATAAGVTYRPMRDDEAPLLREFLGLAIFVEDHADPVPPDIVDSPELAKYIDRWGRPDDVAIVAVDGDDVVGAAWARILPAASPGYGHVDDRTPEIDVSVKEEHRGSGIGTALMTRLLDRLAMRGYARASLSVQKANPARRLYERLGFTTVRDGGSDLVMAVPLSGARWILETPRLALREMNAGDLPALRRILQDDETMNAYEGAFDDAMVDGWLARQLARYRDDGFGPWAVVLRATGEVIGQAGLSWQSILDERGRIPFQPRLLAQRLRDRGRDGLRLPRLRPARRVPRVGAGPRYEPRVHERRDPPRYDGARTLHDPVSRRRYAPSGIRGGRGHAQLSRPRLRSRDPLLLPARTADRATRRASRAATVGW
jgi:RimJ/RimL family protein N-acetyltransferase